VSGGASGPRCPTPVAMPRNGGPSQAWMAPLACEAVGAGFAMRLTGSALGAKIDPLCVTRSETLSRSRGSEKARVTVKDAQAFCAGVAQLVERNLAKVEVASSRLVSRSITCQTQSVCAQACAVRRPACHGGLSSSLSRRGLQSASACGSSSVGRAQPCQG
jgi:hypothetical protein